MRKILSIIAPHSGSGKTTFIVQLLRQVAGLGCLKISPAKEWPGESQREVAVCGEDFFLEDPALLNQPGKDTALYFQAGAIHVERLRHRGSGLQEGLKTALRRFAPSCPVIVESSSAVEFLSPVAVVLVALPKIREMKPSTHRILGRVTDLIVNDKGEDAFVTRDAARLVDSFEKLAPQHICCSDLKMDGIPKALGGRLSELLFPQPVGS